MDIYSEITSRIIAQLDQGIIPWMKPWVASGKAISYSTGKPYSLLNQMLLGKSGEYLTFNECKKAGGHIRKGEKASMIVFWRWIEKEDEETGEVKEIPFLRYYNVFHVDQCEGITAKHQPTMPNTAETDSTAETIVTTYQAHEGITINHEDGDRAFYRPSTDTITVPNIAQFTSTAEYYSTLFHEMVHSTGHPNRLNRINAPAYFGDETYSKEELVAEIGASALVHRSGLETTNSFTNNTAYIQGWLTVLKNDKKFIVSASSQAEKAVNYILGA